MTVKIFVTGHLPAELVQPWLQHLRNFDVLYPGCHFEIGADAPELSLAEMVEAIRVSPGLSFQEIINREKPKP